MGRGSEAQGHARIPTPRGCWLGRPAREEGRPRSARRGQAPGTGTSSRCPTDSAAAGGPGPGPVGRRDGFGLGPPRERNFKRGPQRRSRTQTPPPGTPHPANRAARGVRGCFSVADNPSHTNVLRPGQPTRTSIKLHRPRLSICSEHTRARCLSPSPAERRGHRPGAGANLPSAAAAAPPGAPAQPRPTLHKPLPGSGQPCEGEREASAAPPERSPAPAGGSTAPGPGPSPRAAELRGAAGRAAAGGAPGGAPRRTRAAGRRPGSGARGGRAPRGGVPAAACVQASPRFPGRARAPHGGWAQPLTHAPRRARPPSPRVPGTRGPQMSTQVSDCLGIRFVHSQAIVKKKAESKSGGEGRGGERSEQRELEAARAGSGKVAAEQRRVGECGRRRTRTGFLATRVFFRNSSRDTSPRSRARRRSSTLARPPPASNPQIAQVSKPKWGWGGG